MKILITADLHMNLPARNRLTGRTVFDCFAESVEQEDPDVVVVAGDIGVPEYAARHMGAIRRVVGGRLLAVALGNHDFWLDGTEHARFSNLGQVVTSYWREPARDVGAVLLDIENADLGDLAIVGGYGHFDLGHADPDLRVFGRRITEDIYLSGGMNGLFWNDFRCIPNCGTRVRAESTEQATGIATRMDGVIAGGKRILAAVHTCPWRELNRHPLRGNEQDILSAYSGNSKVGKVIEERATHIDLVVCGHTHMPVRERIIHGITGLNIGTDYGVYRGIIYNTETRSIRWIGTPF